MELSNTQTRGPQFRWGAMIWVNAMTSWSREEDKKKGVDRKESGGLEREAWKNINRMGYEEKDGKISLLLAKTPTSALAFGNFDLK